ncbi:MAG TPA: ImmA/IrrE family metallo-endopeptidase [Oculatellaceae cyanobacterium]
MKVIKPCCYISRAEIESKAVNVLTRVQAKLTRSLKWPIDAGFIAEHLGLDMDCGYIPPDEQGAIAAMIMPTESRIVINENSLKLAKGFEASSIAHEIGHWELHINQNAVAQVKKLQNRGLETSIEPFLCRSLSSKQGIEWQAQYFSGCLLMPQFKLQEECRGRNLTNWKHLYAMKDEFGVTISNLTTRLQSLGMIYIPENSKQIYPGDVAPGLQK